MATIGFPAAMSQGWIGAIAASLLLINVVACTACFWNLRLAWLVAMLFVFIVLAQQLYANLSMTGHLIRGIEPNTLGTIVLIAVNTALLIAPATVICVGYFINRRRIADILMPMRSTKQDRIAATIEADAINQGNPYVPPFNKE